MKYKILHSKAISNDLVTEHYMDIIREALERNGHSVEKVSDFHELCRGDVAIYYTSVDAVKGILRGKRKYILWAQGIYPEERYLSQKNLLYYLILSIAEFAALLFAQKVFLVSHEMLVHYQEKYKISRLANKCLIMPCYNEHIDKKCFCTEKKYEAPTFAYVGSMAKWQCFDKTIDLYKQVEMKTSNSFLYVYTKPVSEAEDKLKKKDIKHFKVEFAEPKLLKEKLCPIKYGFIIRDDIAVNRVATPTKFGNYLASGVIPIISDSLKEYVNWTLKNEFIIVSNENYFIEKVLDFEKKQIDPDEIFNEYHRIFDTHYNDEMNIQKIMSFLEP